MYQDLSKALCRPKLYSESTNIILWNDPHISKQMLQHHLNPTDEAASRNYQFIQDSIKFIAKKASISHESSVIDFGCGPGLYTTAFAELGAQVTGLDFSTNSLKYAKEQAELKGLNIHYIETDYLKYRPESKHDLATLIYCDYCAMSNEGRKLLLQIISDALVDHGTFILDVHTRSRFETLEASSSISHQAEGGFFTPHPHVLIKSTHLYTDEATSLDLYTIYDDSTWKVYNWLKHFDLSTIRAELESGGFKIIEYYSDLTGEPFKVSSHDMAIIAQKV